MPEVSVNIILPSIKISSVAENENISFMTGNVETKPFIEGNNTIMPVMQGNVQFNKEYR